MDTPNNHSHDRSHKLVGIAAMLGACVAAGAVWTVYSYYVMGYIPYGLVFLPVLAGGGSGLILRLGRSPLRQRVGLIAVVVTIAGCICGDFAWIVMSTTKPIGVLLGTELGMTLRTLFWYDKLIFYGITSYLAYAISNPPRVYPGE